MAILTFTSFVMLGEKGDRPTEQSSSLFPSRQQKLNSFVRESESLEESETCCSRSILTLEKQERSNNFFGEPLKHVITVRGQIVVSRTDDDPLLPVCGFKTSLCVPAPRVRVSTHVRVVPACTGTF